MAHGEQSENREVEGELAIGSVAIGIALGSEAFGAKKRGDRNRPGLGSLALGSALVIGIALTIVGYEAVDKKADPQSAHNG